MELKEQENKQNNNKNKQENKLRQILIKTDGNTINIEKIEVAGVYELEAILNNVLAYFRNQIK